MKYLKLIFSIIAISISTLAFSQGNLQYSQAKLVNTIDTVPTGKVWKIEGVIYSGPIASFNYANSQTLVDNIFINGTEVAIRKSSMAVAPYTSSATSIVWEQKFPLWMPAGTTLAASTGVLYINVLEFNTVP